MTVIIFVIKIRSVIKSNQIRFIHPYGPIHDVHKREMKKKHKIAK